MRITVQQLRRLINEQVKLLREDEFEHEHGEHDHSQCEKLDDEEREQQLVMTKVGKFSVMIKPACELAVSRNGQATIELDGSISMDEPHRSPCPFHSTIKFDLSPEYDDPIQMISDSMTHKEEFDRYHCFHNDKNVESILRAVFAHRIGQHLPKQILAAANKM